MKRVKALFVIAAFLFSLQVAADADAAQKSSVITVTGCWYGPGSAPDADAMFFIHNDKNKVDVAKLESEIFSPIVDACSQSGNPRAKDNTCCKLTFEGYLDKKKRYIG